MPRVPVPGLRVNRSTAGVLAALAVLLLSAAPARAEERRWFSAAPGWGEGVAALRVGAGWQPDCACELLARIGAVPLLQAHVEYLNARGTQSVNDVVWDAGALAGLRWPLAATSRWQPFVEFGVGAAAFSHVKIGDRNLATALLFDERLAAGIALDPAGRYQLAAYAEHRSNAGLKEPNQGLTTYGLELRVGLK
jgi:lipid A 3-O-deacylase